MLLAVLPKSRTTDPRCDGCGACCMMATIPPFMASELLRLPRHLQEEMVSVILAGQSGRPCSWFDLNTLLCKNYAHRPDACRRFEPGSDSCETMRKEHL